MKVSKLSPFTHFGFGSIIVLFTEVICPSWCCAEKQMKLVENVMELKKMLVGIGTEVAAGMPSGGLEFFDAAQGQAISKYIFNRYLS